MTSGDFDLSSQLVGLIMAFTWLSGLAGCTESNALKAPHNLRTCDLQNPSGTERNPYFAWFFNDPDDGEIQTAFQLIVSSSLTRIDENAGDVWDSGKVSSDLQNYVYYAGSALGAGRRYYWKVRTWDKDDNPGPYSEKAWLDTGLFDIDDWEQAKWIQRESEESEDYSYFRKCFALPGDSVERSLIHLSVHHSYELYVNGNFVGQGHNHHYPRYGYYHSWDIAEFLSPDTNCIAVWTHWYGGGQGRASAAPGLIVKAQIELDDSTSLTVISDSTWVVEKASQWVTGLPQRNGEGVGRVEMIDSRLNLPGWNTTTFNDSGWQSAFEIGSIPVNPWSHVPQPDLTRVIEETIIPVSFEERSNGRYVIDFGKVYPGFPVIQFPEGNAGDTVEITGGFVLDGDGWVSRQLNQLTNMDYFFILNGEEVIFEPAVYLGMRYLEVNSPVKLEKEDFSFHFRYYELNSDGVEFSSSDSTLNQVWELMQHSIYVGSQEGFVDTPTREKGPFLSDSWSQAVPAMAVLGDRILNLKYLLEFLDSQDQYWADGRLNAVYPNADGARDIPDYTLSYLVWVWDYYKHSGNLPFLKNSYENLKKIIGYFEAYIEHSTGLIKNLEGGGGPYEYGIIDWPPQMRYGYGIPHPGKHICIYELCHSL